MLAGPPLSMCIRTRITMGISVCPRVFRELCVIHGIFGLLFGMLLAEEPCGYSRCLLFRLPQRVSQRVPSGLPQCLSLRVPLGLP
jgi:hypothetical protein